MSEEENKSEIQKPKVSKLAIFSLALSIYLFLSISIWFAETDLSESLIFVYLPLIVPIVVIAMLKRNEIINKTSQLGIKKIIIVIFIVIILQAITTLGLIYKIDLIWDFLGGLFFGFLPLSAVSIPVLGVVSLLFIHYRKKMLRGTCYIFTGLIIWSIALTFHCYCAIEEFRQTACAVNMRELPNAFHKYSELNDGYYPSAENWCDTLVIEGKLPPSFLICPSSDTRFGESSYAFNTNISGMKLDEVPANVVVLFETDAGKEKGKRHAFLESRAFWEHYENKEKISNEQKVYKDRWNQHGGKEIIALKHHRQKGSWVMYGNWSREFVNPEDIDNLQWEVNEVAVELKTGDKAPGFELSDQDGKKVKLSDFAGKKVLLYFYPKADTPGCTKQACSVRDSAEPLKELGVAALGISPDEPGAQKKFDEKYSLGFTLLSDANHKAAQAYGVWGEKSMYGKKYMGIIRSSFLIDEKGKIIQAWYKVSPADTVPNALAVIQAEQ